MDANNGDAYTLRVSPTDSTQTQLLLGGNTVIFSAPTASVSELVLNFGTTNDTLTIDGSNGNPAPVGSVVVDGGSTFVNNFSGSAISVVPDNDNLTVNSGTVTLPSQPLPGSGILAYQLGSVSIAAGASIAVLTASSRSDMTHLSVNSLSISSGGTLNLGGNELIVQGGNISQIASMLDTGYNNGAWNGVGIDSSAAAANSKYALGYAAGSDGVVAGLTSGQVEVLYTLYGDADLDGVVSGSDFTILAENLGKPVTGWDQGDFNYDGVVDGIDFTLLVGNLGRQA